MKMKATSVLRRLRARNTLFCALAVAAVGGASEARAQQNFLRNLTNALHITTDTDEGPDFVRESRPDIKSLEFQPLTGADKPRAAVKTPAELEADKAALVAEREKADARRKRLQAEQVAPVAPNHVAPIKDE
jgi:hypothetical protein